MFLFHSNKQRQVLRHVLLLWFCLLAGPLVAQYPSEKPLQRQVMDLESIRTLPDGRQKLVETLRFTRLPRNVNPESEALLDHSIAYAKTNEDRSLLPELLINKALIAIYKQAVDEAILLLDEASAITKTFPDEQQLAPLNAEAIGYRRANQLDKALIAHERHHMITKGKTDQGMVMHRITNLQNQASLYHYRRQMDKVRQCNEEVRHLIKRIEDPRLVFNVMFNLAGMLINIDEVEEASALLNELMPAIERNTDGRAPRFYEMVAENAQRKGDAPRSAEFFTKVYLTRTANPQQKLRSATQLVRCYIELGRIDSVEKYIRACRELRSNPMTNYGETDQWLVDAQYAAFTSDYETAKTMYLKTLQSASKEGTPYPIPVFQAQIELATLYHRHNLRDSARYYLHKSGIHIKDTNIPRYLKIQYYAAAEAINRGTALAGNKDSVISALKHQLVLKDSLYNQSVTSAYAEMESKYDLHEKEHQLQRALQQQEIQELKLKRQEQRVLIYVLVSSVIIILLAFAALTLIRRRKQVKERHENQLQQLAQRHQIDTARALREAEEEERKKIARKLHDEVGAQLSIARLNIDQLEGDVLSVDSNVGKKLQTAQKLLGDMSKTVRAISHSLMPVALEKYGLKLAILDLINAVNASGKIKVEEVIEGLDDADSWSDEFRFGLYRIVQEVLNNIIKHAHASHVLVQIIELERSVTIYVEDNGKGLDNDEAPLGMGLRLLRSNIEYFNGAIEINGRENHGTFVLIELPLADDQPT